MHKQRLSNSITPIKFTGTLVARARNSTPTQNNSAVSISQVGEFVMQQ